MITTLLLPALLSTLGAASPGDDAYAPLLKAHPASLRWDNLERLPSWCGRARFRKRGALHALPLQEGETLFLPMAAEGWLRVLPVAGEARRRLAVGLTDGAGLAITLPDRADPKGREALFGPVPHQAGLFRLSCPRDGQGPLEIALFTSRLVTAGALPPYSEPLDLPGPARKLGRPGDLQTERWHHLPGNQAVRLEVEGPSRLSLELRLQPGQETMGGGARFEVRWSLDGAPETRESIRTGVDLHEALLLDGRAERLGRREERWINVPPGRHRLSLSSDHAMLARLHGEGPGHYLAPGANLPRPWVPEALPPAGQGDSARLARIEASARDPRFRDPGLAGLAHLDEWLRERPEDRALGESRDRSAAEWTTFRTLLPTVLPRSPLRPAYAWLRGLTADPLTASVRRAGGPLDLDLALAGLPQVTFHSMAPEAVFHLSPRIAPSELRLLVDRSQTLQQSRLHVQFDDHPPRTLEWGDPAPLPQEWQAPSLGDLGLALLAQAGDWRSQPLLQGGEGWVRQAPLPLVEASAVRIPLPFDVQRVRVWADPSTAGPPPFMALQIRHSLPPELPFDLPSLPDPEAIHEFLLRSEGAGPEARPWLPLRRWLRAQSEAFRSRVNLDPPMLETLKGHPSPEALPQILSARSSEAQGRTLAAMRAWAEAFRAASGPPRREALEGLHRTLSRLGEPALAEQWLKAALLHGEPSLRQGAFDLLERLYREAGATSSRLALLAVSADQHPVPGRLVPLAEALLEEGQALQSLRVLTLMSPAAAPHLWVRVGRILQSGAFLDAGIKAMGPSTDPALLDRWNAWVGRQPGPWSWRAEPWLVKGAPGAAQLRNVSLDSFQSAYRALPGAPVRLQVVGPVRLRLEAHPLHPAGASREIQGCLEIQGADWRRRLPFAENWPAPGLEIEGRPGERPGQRLACEVDLPAGLHDLEIGLGDLPALVLPFAFRPEVSLGTLPPRSPEAPGALQVAGSTSPIGALSGGGSGLFLAMEGRYGRVDLEGLRRALLAPLPASAPWPRGKGPAASRPLSEGPEALRSAPPPDAADPRAVAARLDALASQSLDLPEAQPACLALAEALVSACPAATLHSSALGILRRGALWTPAGTTASGAGLRILPDEALRPFAPAARIRQALLPEATPWVLSGLEASVYHFQQSASWILSLEATPFLPSLGVSMPVVLKATLDSTVQRWTLDPQEGPRRLHLSIPAGRHSLRLELEAPFEGQWVAFRFPKGLGAGRLERPGRPFEVGTREAPLRFSMEGPRWVRADRWRGDGIESEYRFLPPGPQTWTVAPDPGESEVLCAFSYQEVVPGRLMPLARPWSVPVHPVPGPEGVPQGQPQAPQPIRDTLALGGQEDGTSTFRLRHFSRLDPADPQEEVELERAVEVAFEHRHQDSRSGRYWLGRAALRQWESSGTSLGLRGSVDLPLDPKPLAVFWHVEAFGQAGAGAGMSQARGHALRLEGGFRLPFELGRRTRHTPELAGFWGHQAYSHLGASERSRLDLDIWSPFRERNPWGLKASESLHHRPWQDTLWTAQVSTLLTRPQGEGPTFARTAFQGAWRQRLGPLELRVEAGVARYGKRDLATAPLTRSHAVAALEGLAWTSRQNLLTLSAEVRRDFEHRVWTGAVSLGWSFGNGRGLQDMRGGERAFHAFDARTLSRHGENGWKDLPR